MLDEQTTNTAIGALNAISKESVVFAFIVVITAGGVVWERMIFRPRRAESAAAADHDRRLQAEERAADRVLREKEIAAAVKSAEANQASAEAAKEAIGQAAAIVENAKVMVVSASAITERLTSAFERVEGYERAKLERARERRSS